MEMVNPNDRPYVEIIGIHYRGNGRRCSKHDGCGKEIQVDTLLKIKRVVLVVKGVDMSLLAVYKMSGGEETCMVGFLNREFLATYERYNNKLVQVTELYKNSTNEKVVMRGEVNNGICGAVFLHTVDNDIPDSVTIKKRRVYYEEQSEEDKIQRRLKWANEELDSFHPEMVHVQKDTEYMDLLKQYKESNNKDEVK